jgi:hypothetical protein
MLETIEKMLEDEPTGLDSKKAATKDGVETALYTEIAACGPNPNIMGEKENVLRSKATFKLLNYFVNMPDVSDLDGESWLSRIMARSAMVVDKANEAAEMLKSGLSPSESGEF